MSDKAYDQIQEMARVPTVSDAFREDLAVLIERHRITAPTASPASVDPAALLASLRDLHLPAAGLFKKAREANLHAHSNRVAVGIAELLLQGGEPVLAFDIVDSALKLYPGDLGLRQMQALALARSGATERAEEILSSIEYDGIQDADTFALMGGVQRDLAIRTRKKDPRKAEALFKRSLTLYRHAYDKEHRDYFLARAAVMALLSRQQGATDEARDTAREVLKISEERLRIATGSERFWPLVLQGEAYLILKEKETARTRYAEAVQHVGRRFGDLASARRHAMLLFEHQGLSWDADPMLRIPPVVVFVGHMIDPPDNGQPSNPRFPSALEPRVRSEILRRVQASGAKLGFASAACGADILFHEIMQHDMEGEATVVLPCDPGLFVKSSVQSGGSVWVDRFRAILSTSQYVSLADQLFDFEGLSFTYGNKVLTGLAASKALQLGAELKFLAVWDGKPGRGPGGTADHVNRWKDRGYAVDVIDLGALLRRHLGVSSAGSPSPLPALSVPKDSATAAPSPTQAIDFKAKIVGVLFADVAGFSKLNEKQLLDFVRLFLGSVADLLKKSGIEPLKKNTWGDGLFFVFDDVGVTGKFALDLSELVAEKRPEWTAQGLPPELDLRTAVHAGPVFLCTDPVTALPNCMGMHVSRTARIEPITPEGQVYATQEFAAIAEADGITEFECCYVGQTEFAKKYGTFPMYHLSRRR